MEFGWTEEHVSFRNRVRSVIDRELPRDWVQTSRLDNGSDASVAFARYFCPLLAKEGLLVPHWRREDGGEGLDVFHHWILNEEMWSVGEPRSYQYMNVNWIGPAILRFGTEAQRAKFIPMITGGTTFFCQGFSEPNAGSDLAALSTKAVETATGFRITGQKIWTSAASFADYCVLLARTGLERTSGISVFLVPMDADGVTVRVIGSLQGARAIHEVFFDDVEVGPEALLGEVDKGWGMVRAMLANERIGVPRYALGWPALKRVVAVLRERGRFDDADVRARARACDVAYRAARLGALKVLDGRAKGNPADTDTNLARYAAVTADRRFSEFVADYAPHLTFPDADPLVAAAYKRAASIGIAAGSAEVQLDLIARNHLGLPRS